MWVIGGFVLALFEFVTPGGFYVIFFACSAVLVGVAVGAGLNLPEWAQWASFTVIAVAGLALFRERLLAKFATGKGMPDIEGGIALPLQDLAAGAFGKAEFRGTHWAARNVGGAPVKAGQRCTVDRAEGLTLMIRAEEG